MGLLNNSLSYLITEYTDCNVEIKNFSCINTDKYIFVPKYSYPVTVL